jgi:hypothetical protein
MHLADFPNGSFQGAKIDQLHHHHLLLSGLANFAQTLKPEAG